MAEHLAPVRTEHGRRPEAARQVNRRGHLAAGRRGAGVTPLPPASPRMRLPELLTGIVVVVGCALGAVLWHNASTSTRQALVITRPVERGHVFELSDFGAANVAAEGMRLVAYADRDRMVGRIASTDLAAASPITDSVALAAVPLVEGEGLVGCRLEAGEYPAGLAPGATVQVILVVEHEVATAGAPTKESITLEQPAVVDAVAPLTNLADAAVVTLRLPKELARQVAAADGVRLVQVGA